MATYIQGITDYIPEIQQYQPDFDFFNSVLEKRQSLYDEAREKISDVYNSVLNNPMLRSDDIAKREEFFKQIDTDIKKISRMDLSLKQNQQQATHVFSQLLDDKNIAHDMVFTKKANDALKYGEYLRESGDSGYWSGMEQNIKYDMLGYQNADDQSALTMSAPKYIKRVDIMSEIMDKVKDMKFDVSEESPFVKVGENPDGTPIMKESKWIIKRKNGALVQPYLEAMFVGEYGNRGDVMDYYKEVAKNTRLNWATQHAGEYGSFDEANKAYIQEAVNLSRRTVEEQLKSITDISDNKKSQIVSAQRGLEKAQELEDDYSAEYYTEKLNEYVNELNNIQSSKDYLTIQNNKAVNGSISPEMIDYATAVSMLGADIKSASEIASMRGMEVSYKENPYVKMEMEHSFQLKKMALQHEYNKDLENYKHKKDNELLPMQTVDLGYQEGGSTQYDSDERGGVVIDRYNELRMTGNDVGGKASVLRDAYSELRSIAEDSSNSNSWRAKELLASMAMDFISDDEKTEIASEVGGNYDKIYERLKDTNIDFNTANPLYISNAYEKLKNDWGIVNGTRLKHQSDISRLDSHDKALEEAFAGTIHDMSASIEMLDDKEKALVRAYFGIGKNNKYSEWDGSPEDFDGYFHTAQQYLGQGGLTRHDIIKYWENGKAKRLAGEALDNVSQKTKYAILRGMGNMGLDGQTAKSTSVYTNNKENNPMRVDAMTLCRIAANSPTSVVYEGMIPAGGKNNDDLKLFLDTYASQLSNTQDSKSKAAYSFSCSIHPIAGSNKDLYGFSIRRDDAKEDDADYQGITMMIPKDELRGRNIKSFDATDKLPYENALYWANGPVPIPEARNTSSKIIDKGKYARDIMIGSDVNGMLYAQGRAFVYDKNSGYVGWQDFSTLPINEYQSADDAVAKIVEMISMGDYYANQYGYGKKQQ